MEKICAISTPAGVGGIAVLRLSGEGVKEFVEKFLARQSDSRKVSLRARMAMFCTLSDGVDLIDEVVATYFQAPHSYTGEDVVEISCHGSLYVQQRLLQLFIDNGARLAEPGEFTMRAFLNGRMDLSQAEAVADLIDSRSESAHRLAISQMRGGYAKELETLRQQLIDTAALLELELDFSDEDVEFVSRDRVSSMIVDLKTRVTRLIESFQTGNAIKRGIPVAIVGRPNVGKSTLLNALLGEERAIVSDIPGTTRDTIEETIEIEGFTFRFIDTAGLRLSDDAIEMMGVERSKEAVKRANIVLYVVDGDDCDVEVEDVTKILNADTQSLIVVRNKVDSCPTTAQHGINISHLQNLNVAMLSAKTGIGLSELKKKMVDSVREHIDEQGDVLLTNARHYESLCRVLSALVEVQKGLETALTPDLVVIDLRDALYHLGTITGNVSSEEVLGSIFSRFCIGK